MKFIIEGREYPFRAPTVWEMGELEEICGISAQEFEELSPTRQKLVFIWFARYQAGERLTLQQANDFSIDDFDIAVEPGDPVAVHEAVAAADPTRAAPTASPRADGRPAATDRPPAKRKASKKAS